MADAALSTPVSLAIAGALVAVVIATDSAKGTAAFGSGSPAATKPYATFAEFYPFYLSQHAGATTKLTHYIGTTLFILMMLMWARGRLVLPLVAGLTAGYFAFPFLRSMASGLPEMALMVAIYVLGGYAATGSWAQVLTPMIVAYGFAWVGHFVFEKNKPATFIYPSYSLMGDFVMLYQGAKGLITKA